MIQWVVDDKAAATINWSKGYKALIDHQAERLCKKSVEASGCVRHEAYKIDTFIFVIKASGENAKVLVTVQPNNFLAHPRSGSLRQIPYFNNVMDQFYLTSVYGGGYREDLKEIENRYSYPLQDADKGTWAINSDDVSIEWTEGENYGNIWWIGEDGTTLSWKGPPNRHWNVGPDINIPGLSKVENKVGELEYFTMFSSNVYESGEIVYTAPNGLIIGACYYLGKFITMTVTIELNVGYWFQVWADGGELPTKIKTSRAHIPVFINKAGNKFVFDNVAYVIDSEAKTFAVLKDAAATTGSQSEPKLGTGYWYDGAFTKTGKRLLWSEPDVEIKPLYDLKTSTSSTANGSVTTKTTPVYREKIDTTGLSISGAREVQVGSCYTPNITTCEVGVWSFDKGTIDANGCVTAISCISGSSAIGNVSLTLGSSSASIQVLLPNAVWDAGTTTYHGNCTGDFPVFFQEGDGTRLACNESSGYSAPALPNSYMTATVGELIGMRPIKAPPCDVGSESAGACAHADDAVQHRYYALRNFKKVYVKVCP